MADPWNSAQPVNANTVKDTVPDEFQALKDVARKRLTFVGGPGTTSTVVAAPVGGGLYNHSTTVKWATVVIATGESIASNEIITVARAGYYRIAVTAKKVAAASGEIAASLFVATSTDGISYTNQATVAVPTASLTYLQTEVVVPLNAGNRIAINLQTLVTNNSTSPYTPESLINRLSVEFMRPLTLP